MLQEQPKRAHWSSPDQGPAQEVWFLFSSVLGAVAGIRAQFQQLFHLGQGPEVNVLPQGLLELIPSCARKGREIIANVCIAIEGVVLFAWGLEKLCRWRVITRWLSWTGWKLGLVLLLGGGTTHA